MTRWIGLGLACLLLLAGLVGGAAGNPRVVLADTEGSTVNEAAGLKLDVRCREDEVTLTNVASTFRPVYMGHFFIIDGNDTAYKPDPRVLKEFERQNDELVLPTQLGVGQETSGYLAFLIPPMATGEGRFLFYNSFASSEAGPVLGLYPEVELLIQLHLELGEVSEARATVHALETQAADLKTKTAPTPTTTLTPTNTPIPTATLTSTNTPIPPTATPSRDAATIAALQTEIAALESGTPAATGTPIPVPAATSAKTATPKPANTPKPKATNTPLYPSAVAALVREDSVSTCDRIGWNALDPVTNQIVEPDINGEHFPACGNGLLYVIGCGTTDGSGMVLGPAPGNVYVACAVFLANGGTSEAFVSPLDFTLIDASNTRYDISYTALAASGSANVFPSDRIPPDQKLKGLIIFEVPFSAATPLRIEIDPLIDYSLDSEPLIIILDPLGTID